MSKKKKKTGLPESAPRTAEKITSGEAPPLAWSERFGRITLAIILAGSFLLGFAAISQFKNSPFFNFPIVDEAAYVKWGSEIAEGKYRGAQVFYQDPLYPYTLSLLFDVFGSPESGKKHAVWAVIRLLQALMAMGTVYLVYLTAKRLAGEPAAQLAALLAALHRGIYFFALQIEKATMTTLLAAAACYFGVLAAEPPFRRRWFLLCGLTLGLLTLLRGNFIPLLPLAVVWVFWAARGPRFARAALLAAGIAAVILPVSLRNYQAGGEFVLTTSQGGANFYIGNNEQADGRYIILPFVRANPLFEASDFKAEAERRAGRSLRPPEVSRFWFGEAGKWIAGNPGRAFTLLLHKARLMIHDHEVPDFHNFYLLRSEFVSALYLPVLGFGLLWGPAILGMWVRRRDRKASFPAVFALFYFLSIVPFFIVDRYRTAVIPAMVVFAAIFFHWAWEKWKQSRWRELWPYAPPLAAALLLGFWPTTESRMPMGYEFFNLGNAYLTAGDPPNALLWYDKALAAVPDQPGLEQNRNEALMQIHGPDAATINRIASRPGTTAAQLVELAQSLEAKGDFRAAAQAYEAAAAKDPDNLIAHARLGTLYAAAPGIKDLKRSLEHFHKALAVNSGDLETTFSLGNVYSMAGDTTKARRYWTETLRINPDYGPARQNLMVLEAQKGAPEEK